MMMTPRLRKFVLTTHIMTSVGWIGAAAAFLPLAIIVLSSQDSQTVRAAYLAMDVIARFIIVPSSFAALLTGLVLSLFTPWGLFRHYWVLVKLEINIVAILVLLNYMDTLSQLVGVAAKTALSSADLLRLRAPTSVAHAGGALLFLLVATVLSVYKPRGLTRYGWRKQQKQRKNSKAVDTTNSVSDQANVLTV
jgi:hypothetical protein